MSITQKSMRGQSIINNLEVTNQIVQNVLNVATYQQPPYSYGTFSSGSLIPIVFSTGGLHKFAEIKISFKPTNNTYVFISAKDTANADVSVISEPSEIIYKTTPINSTTSQCHFKI
jgi:hypothetical protein